MHALDTLHVCKNLITSQKLHIRLDVVFQPSALATFIMKKDFVFFFLEMFRTDTSKNRVAPGKCRDYYHAFENCMIFKSSQICAI